MFFFFFFSQEKSWFSGFLHRRTGGLALLRGRENLCTPASLRAAQASAEEALARLVAKSEALGLGAMAPWASPKPEVKVGNLFRFQEKWYFFKVFFKVISVKLECCEVKSGGIERLSLVFSWSKDKMKRVSLGCLFPIDVDRLFGST